MVRKALFFLILALTILSCSTGKKAFERGDYYTGTMQSINRLRSNPESKKASKALKDSYPMAITYYTNKINQTLATNSSTKYSQIVEDYQRLNQMAEEISRCPAALKVFPNANYYLDELNKAKENAAEEHYAAGIKFEQENNRSSWKSAYFAFNEALKFVPDYKDAVSRMNNAKSMATWIVIIEPIQVPRDYQLSSDFFYNQVMENLATKKPSEFVAFYSPESAERAGVTTPDQVLQLNFDEFVVGQFYDKETIRDCSKDSVVVGTVKMPDGSSKKVYNTVKAKLKTYRREVISKGLLDATLMDFQGNKVLSQRKFPGQYTWFSEWGSFNGDERALTKNQLEICNRKPMMPPDHQTLFIEFTKPIYDQMISYLRDWYRKY